MIDEHNYSTPLLVSFKIHSLTHSHSHSESARLDRTSPQQHRASAGRHGHWYSRSLMYPGHVKRLLTTKYIGLGGAPGESVGPHKRGEIWMRGDQSARADGPLAARVLAKPSRTSAARLRRPSRPRSSNSPRSANSSPEPESTSRTVVETKISLGCDTPRMRAVAWTAIPRTSSP